MNNQEEEKLENQIVENGELKKTIQEFMTASVMWINHSEGKIAQH